MDYDEQELETAMFWWNERLNEGTQKALIVGMHRTMLEIHEEKRKKHAETRKERKAH